MLRWQYLKPDPHPKKHGVTLKTTPLLLPWLKWPLVEPTVLLEVSSPCTAAAAGCIGVSQTAVLKHQERHNLWASRSGETRRYIHVLEYILFMFAHQSPQIQVVATLTSSYRCLWGVEYLDFATGSDSRPDGVNPVPMSCDPDGPKLGSLERPKLHFRFLIWEVFGTNAAKGGSQQHQQQVEETPQSCRWVGGRRRQRRVWPPNSA